jgi:hypothetical protein
VLPHLSGPGWAQGLVDQLNNLIVEIWKKLGTKAALVHAHGIADVTGLQVALNGKAASDHTHPGGNGAAAAWGDITGTLADQTDLQAALDAKGTSNFSGAYADLSGLPTLFSGSYADLTNKPTLFSGAYADLTGKPALFDGAYSSLSGIPASFTPAAHNQAISTITGLQAALDGKQASGSYAASNHNHDAAYAAIDHTHEGGGSDPWTIAALAADFTTTSATAVDVTGLSFTPAANGRYMFEAVVGIRSATATVNPRIGFAWATGLTDGVCSIDESQTATARLMANGNIGAALLVAVGGVPNTTQSWPVTIWGWVKAGATPSGSIRIQLASETAGTTVRATANSYLRYRSY